MVAHAELPEAERADGRLRPSTWRSFSAVICVAVREAGRQAREGRLVPGRAARGPATARGSRPSTARPRSAARARRAGAPPSCRAGGRRGRPRWRRRPALRSPRRAPSGSSFANSSSLQKKHRFGGLAAYSGLSSSAGLDDHVAQADQGGELPRLLQLAFRVGLGVGGHQHRAVAERFPGGPAEERGVDAAREGDRDALELPQAGEQALVLGPGLRRDRRQGARASIPQRSTCIISRKAR